MDESETQPQWVVINGDRYLDPLYCVEGIPTWRLKLNLAKRHLDRLNDWQTKFVQSPIWDRIQEPTIRQYAKICEIWDELLRTERYWQRQEARCWRGCTDTDVDPVDPNVYCGDNGAMEW